jgi:hypothetical protein
VTRIGSLVVSVQEVVPVMLIFLGIVALVAGAVALVLVPLRLPWPQRVRWLVAANALGSWGIPTDPAIVREVFVVDLYDDTPPRRVVVRPAGRPVRDTSLALPDTAGLSSAAQLARWRAAATPLLLVSDGRGGVSLHGPARSVCGLSDPAAAGSQGDVPWSTA